jgi:uncharacterized protein YecE (DUF72 family)
MKKLNDVEESVDTFLQHASGLGKKLGPILFQLPPRWNMNAERLDGFLKLLPHDHRYAFEFRDPSWYDPAIYTILRKKGCAFCIYELAGHRSPLEVTADFVYVRLHGPGDKYQGSYHTHTLNAWAKRIKEWQGEGKDTFVYFDNDQEGYAVFNAQKLKEMNS